MPPMLAKMQSACSLSILAAGIILGAVVLSGVQGQVYPFPMDVLEKIVEPELFQNVSCFDQNRSRRVCQNVSCVPVPCQRIYILGLLWKEIGPTHVSWPMFYTFERMARMINVRQENICLNMGVALT